MIEWGHYEWLESLEVFSKKYDSFVANVYKEVSQTHLKSFVISPFSLHALLGFMYYCGEDETAKQISSALYLPNCRNKIPEVFRNRINSLIMDPPVNILKNASMLCLRQDCQFKDIYKMKAKECFGMKISHANFEDKEGFAKGINKWIMSRTQKRIKDAIHESDVAQDTRVMIVNAISFQGQWRLEFPKYTSDKRYFSPDVEFIPMMEVTDFFNYSENAELGAQFLEIPYEGNIITMTFVLPIDNNELSALEDCLEAVLNQSHCYQKVHVVIPKLKIESTVEFKPMLRWMGISDAFEETADFSKIGNGGKGLPISSVIQKTQLIVEETGTIITKPCPYTAYIKHAEVFVNYKTFVANRPFLYFIKNSSGVLFIGRYCYPSPIN